MVFDNTIDTCTLEQNWRIRPRFYILEYLCHNKSANEGTDSNHIAYFMKKVAGGILQLLL